MPYDEFLKWQLYFEARPIEWRNDNRAMKLLQAQGVKERPETIFESLRVFNQPQVECDPIQKNFKNTTLFANLLSAKGGKVLDV